MNAKIIVVFAVLVVVAAAVSEKEPQPKPTVLRQRKWSSVASLHAKSARHHHGVRHQRRHGQEKNVKPEPRFRGVLQNAWNHIQNYINSRTSTARPDVYTSTANYYYPEGSTSGQIHPGHSESDTQPAAHEFSHEQPTSGYGYGPARQEDWPADTTSGHGQHTDLPYVDGGYWVPVNSSLNGTHNEQNTEGYWEGSTSDDWHNGNGSGQSDYSSGTEDYYNQENSAPDYWQQESTPDYWRDSSDGYWHEQSTPDYWHEESTPDNWQSWTNGYWTEQSTPDYWEQGSTPDRDYFESSEGYWDKQSTPDYWNHHSTDDYWHQPATEDYWGQYGSTSDYGGQYESTPDYWGHPSTDYDWYDHSSSPDNSYGYTEPPPSSGCIGQPPPPPSTYQPVANNGGCSFTITILPGGCGQPTVQQQCGEPSDATTAPPESYTTYHYNTPFYE